MKNINAIDQYINAMVDLFAKNPISDEQLIQMEIKELLKILYNADANNININAGNTLLHHAVTHAHFNTVEDLIKKGADVNVQNKSGNTPLHLTIFWGNTEMAKLLIEKGTCLSLKNKDGYTPLSLALDKGKNEIATMLIQKEERNKRQLDEDEQK